MTDPITSWAFGLIAGVVFGFRCGLIWAKPSRRHHQPYSSAAIAFRATAEDAAKVRSKIVNPLVWEDPPEPMTDDGRVVDAHGRIIGYIPRPQGRTPNPPPSDHD